MKSRSILFLIIVFFFSFLNHAHAFLEKLPPEVIWCIINHIPQKQIPYQYKVAQGYISTYRPQDAEKHLTLFQFKARQRYTPFNQREIPQKYISFPGLKRTKRYVLLAPRVSTAKTIFDTILTSRHGMILSLRLINTHLASVMSDEKSPLQIKLSDKASRKKDDFWSQKQGMRVIDNPSPYLPVHATMEFCPPNADLQKLGRSQARLKSLRFSCSRLSRYEKTDYENLPTFTSLTTLYIDSTPGFLINEGRFLAHLTNLQNLTMTDCHGFKNLESMTHLTNLHTLSLYGYHYIEDLSLISSLTTLHTLYLMGTNAKIFPSLSALTNLESLGIRDDELTTTAPLMNLSHLTELDLGGSRKLHDISHLSTLTTLENLGLSSTVVTSLQPLTNLQDLKHLNLSYVRTIVTFNPLSHLVNLESINVDLTKVDSFVFLRSLTSLQKIRIEECFTDKDESIFETEKRLPNLKVSISKHDYEEGY